MKARVKATGEIVCIERNLDYRGGYVASDGRLYNVCDLELIVDADPDYWTRLEHQYAGMAMQGLLANHYITDRIDVSVLITETASSIAHALVEKMKNIRKRFAKLKDRKEIMLGMGFPYDESSPIAYNEVVFHEWAKNNGKWEEISNKI